MMQGFTIDAVKKSACGHLNLHITDMNDLKAMPKISKYGNKKCVVDDIVFDSVKEAKRYRVLKMLRKSGLIAYLKTQVEFELNEGGTHSLKYVADFCYTNAKTGEYVVEDTKGFLTREYKKKRRLMMKVHGIKILET